MIHICDMNCKTWYMIYDTWYMIHDTWYMGYDLHDIYET
jgi:hypothetical protein